MTAEEKLELRMRMSRDFKQGFEAGRTKTIDECILLLNKIEEEYRLAICEKGCIKKDRFLDGILSAMFTVIQSVKQLKEQK